MNGNWAKNLLEEARALNGENKKRVVIIGTIVIMAIVIGVWMSYFNNTLAENVSSPSDSDQTASAAGTVSPSSSTDSGMWQNIENGVVWMGNIIKGSSDYKIQPQNN